MLKVFILTDLEGACMVNRWEQTRAEEVTPLKQQAMTHLTQEVNAAVDGVLEIDPNAMVVVWDGHGNGGIDVMQFHPRAWLLARGRGEGQTYFVDESFDALMFVGQHAMAGTPDAPLCHTYSSKTVEYYKLNGQLVGEFACRAAMAGAMGVPTVFLSGDDKATAEARQWAPGIVTVDTKIGLGIERALHRPVADVRDDIRQGVMEALERRKEIAPVRVESPYIMESRVLPGCSIEGYLKRGPHVKKVDDRTVRCTVDDLRELWI